MKSSTLSTLVAVALIIPTGAFAADHGHGTTEATEHVNEHATAQVTISEPNNDNEHAATSQTVTADHQSSAETEALETESKPSETNEPTEPQHFELQGTVSTASANSFTAAGQTIAITHDTHVEGTLSAGATVHAEGTNVGGTLTAKEVNVISAQAKADLKDEFHSIGSGNSETQSGSAATITTPTSTPVPAAVSTEGTTHEQATAHAGVTAQALANAQHELTTIFERISSFLANLFHA